MKSVSRSKKAGLPPGSLVHVGKRKVGRAKIRVISYSQRQYRETEVGSVEECISLKHPPGVSWINVSGIHNVGMVEALGKHLGLHPLVMEDIVNSEQRPKLEDFADYVFMVLRVPYVDEESGRLKSEQVSIICGSELVVTFLERDTGVFSPIVERLKTEGSRVRNLGADYLAYTLVDVIVDNYFIVMESLEKDMEDLEEKLVTKPDPDVLHSIHTLKRDIISLGRSVWPLREVINSLRKGESSIINKGTEIYLGDVYDHTIRIIEGIETFREMITDMMDVYLSSVSNKMNEIMMVLTIIGTIFIPLTFITGIYGMNFEYMPELKWHLGYPMVLILMLGIGIVMLTYFRKKGWL